MPATQRITSTQADRAGPAAPTSGRDQPGTGTVPPTKRCAYCKQDSTAVLTIPSKAAEVTLPTAKQHAKLAPQPLKNAINSF